MCGGALERSRIVAVGVCAVISRMPELSETTHMLVSAGAGGWQVWAQHMLERLPGISSLPLTTEEVNQVLVSLNSSHT